MEPRERATSIWYRIAGLIGQRDIALDIIEAEIRSAQHEALLEAEQLVVKTLRPGGFGSRASQRRCASARSGRSASVTRAGGRRGQSRTMARALAAGVQPLNMPRDSREVIAT